MSQSQQQNLHYILDPAKSLELSAPNLPRAKFHVHATFATEHAVIAFAVAKFITVFPLTALSGGLVLRSTLEHSANMLAELLDMKFAHKKAQWRSKVSNRKKEALQMIEEAHEENKSKPTQCILFHLRILNSFVVFSQQHHLGKQKLAAPTPVPRLPMPKKAEKNICLNTNDLHSRKNDDDSGDLLFKGVVEMLAKIQIHMLKEKEHHEQEHGEEEKQCSKNVNKSPEKQTGKNTLPKTSFSSYSSSSSFSPSSSSGKEDEEKKKKKPFIERCAQKFAVISPIASTVAAGFTIAYTGIRAFAEEG